jgi:hypothetical protein
VFACRDTDAVSITAEPEPGREDGPDIPEETAEPAEPAEPAAARPPAAAEARDAEKDDPDDPFAGLVLDDAFVKAATSKEQSARARGLAARWKHQPPVVVPFRAEPEPRRRLFRRRPPRLDPWGQPVRRKRRPLPTALLVLVAVALVLAALNPGAVRKLLAEATSRAGTGQTASPVTGPSATPDPGVPTVDQPFAGSPAAAWPSGADGIVLPAAKAYGNVSTSRVAANLQRVKQFLVATNLDPAVLAGATPSAALGLVDPTERVDTGGLMIDHLRASLALPSAANDPTWFVTRFNTKAAELIGSTIKVNGHTTLAGDGQGGTLITSDYTFVYALRSRGPDPLVARTIVRRSERFDVPDGSRYAIPSGTLILAGFSSFSANGGCAHTGFLTPEFDDPLQHQGPAPSGAPVDPYDRSGAIPQGGGCHLTTRT